MRGMGGRQVHDHIYVQRNYASPSNTQAPAEEMADIYQPLQDSDISSHDISNELSQSFRVLKLCHGDAGSNMTGHISNTTIGTAQRQYDAISYVCGDPQKSACMFVNGKRFPVTANLYECLAHLRPARSDRQLWIDAVCINQWDLDERSLQVQRLGSVYSKARSVIVFLGPERDSSSDALLLLEQLSGIALGNHDAIRELLEEASRASSWQALLQFFARPWWTRAWIVQEYVIGAEVTLLCGYSKLSGHLFGKAMENLVDYRFKATVVKRHESLIRHVAKTPIHHLWSARYEHHHDIGRTNSQAMNVLYKFRGSQCSDPRDKVFSIWSLIEQHPLLKPSYTTDTRSVYEAVVQAAIESSGDLEVLTHHNRSVGSSLDLPTWCPDWTVLRGKRIRLWPNEYQACGFSNHASFKLVNHTLILKGIEVARIEHLESFESNDFRNEHYIRQKLYDVEHQACESSQSDCDRMVRLDELRKTFVACKVRPDGPQGGVEELKTGAGHRLWDAWCSAIGEPLRQEKDQDSKVYGEALYSALSGRCVFFSNTGQFGLVDGTAKAGDLVYIFAGGLVPFAIRHRVHLGAQVFELVGEW